MSVIAARVTATASAPTTPIAENTHGDTGSDDNTAVRVLIRRTGAAVDVYLDGTTAVDSTTGFPWLAADPAMEVVLEPGEKLYARTAAGSQTLATIATGR
jgi:hypothetical protein